MKLDLSHLLRDEPRDDTPFRSTEEAKEYLVRYLLSFISIELDGLPRDQWEKTLRTWIRIIALGMALSRKNRKEREAFYREKGFDLTMEAITEDVIRVSVGLGKLGLLRSNDPKEFLRVVLNLVEGEKELLEREGIGEEKLKFMREFLLR